MKGPWIVTHSGTKFRLDKIEPKSINLEDIAHGLSYTCRYNGQCHSFFSVAEHSCLIAEYLARRGYSHDIVRQALLHDAAEAYVGDMVHPLKTLMPEFKAYEEMLMGKILRKFKLPAKLDPIIKETDVRISLNEKAVLFPSDYPRWELEDRFQPLEGIQLLHLTPPDIYVKYKEVLEVCFG